MAIRGVVDKKGFSYYCAPMFKKPICLVGFMGSGKSTLAELLSEKLHIPFFDTDLEIEKREKGAIHEIFLGCGEEGFRKIEAEVLKEIFDKNKKNFFVLATGGGTLETKENKKIVLENFTSVYLKTSFSEIKKRILEQKTYHRFLWREDSDQTLFTKRQPLYHEAHFVVTTDGKTPLHIADKIISLLI